MTLPSLLFGALIASLYGAGFHLWRGGGFGRLMLYLILAWAGFWAGHLIGARLEWTFANIGPLNLGMATLVSVLFLAVGHWLSLVEVQRK